LNGYFVTVGQVGFFLAPLAAGWLIERSGAAAALSLAGVGCLAAAGILGPLRARETTGAADKADAAGDRKLKPLFFVQTPWLFKGLCLAVLANLLIVPIATVLVPLRVNEVSFGAMQLGYFYAALSAGIALAGLMTMPRIAWIGESVQLALFLCAASVTYLLTYFFDLLPVILVCGLVVGALLSLFEVNWNSMIQERTLSGMVGRVYGASSWLSFVARTAGVALAGWIANRAGTQEAITTCVVVAVIAIAAALPATRLFVGDESASETTKANA
jgi:hypothetical protein